MSRSQIIFVFLVCVLLAAPPLHAVEVLRQETEQFFPIARDGSIKITNTDGEIHIFSWRELRVRFATLRRAYSTARLQQIKVETHASATALTARTIISAAHGFFADRSGTVDYTINVPEAAHLKLTELNGEISVVGLRGGTAEISLGNGRATAFDCSGRVHAHAKTGALEVFYLWWENLPAAFDYSIKYGTIRAFFPPAAQFRVDALTTDGNIDTEFLHKEVRDLGRGQQLIFQTAPNAPVNLRFRDNSGNISIDTSGGVSLPPTLAARTGRPLQIAPAN